MTNFLEIPLAEITPSPMNPRKSFDARALSELADSIKAVGVLEPIIVRPVTGAKAEYEIVAGERRFRAAAEAGLATIPVIVKEISDEQAYDLMLIENLQRKDLSEREEAQGFALYIDRHGEESIPDLAERTGIRPAYIRGRARVLDLPKSVLKLWDEGELAYGHLQQLLRLDVERRKEAIFFLSQRLKFEESVSVAELVEHIDRQFPELSKALFKTKEFCLTCGSNSATQGALFDFESKKVRCSDPACFRRHQVLWIEENWKKTPMAKLGTKGFRFREDVGYDIPPFGRFREPGKKCLDCENFITIVDLEGAVKEDKACAGDKACYRAVTNPKSAEEETGKKNPGAPRVSWHGENFRDLFYRARIEAEVNELDPFSPAGFAVLIAAMSNDLNYAKNFGSALDDNCIKTEAAVGKILAGDRELLIKAARAAILDMTMKGATVDAKNGCTNGYSFGTANRAAVARFLGVDLAKEYAVGEEYLNAKTKAEILAFGKKFKVFAHPAAVTKLAGQAPDSLKKTELMEVVMSLGDDLVGKVPDEILKAGKK